MKAEDPKHKLGYRFTSLPFRDRIEILEKLELLTEEDGELPYSEQFLNAFRRAKKRNQLEQLREEVERAHGEKKTVIGLGMEIGKDKTVKKMRFGMVTAMGMQKMYPQTIKQAVDKYQEYEELKIENERLRAHYKTLSAGIGLTELLAEKMLLVSVVEQLQEVLEEYLSTVSCPRDGEDPNEEDEICQCWVCMANRAMDRATNVLKEPS